MNIKLKLLTGFDTERLREKLLNQKKYKKLLVTYFEKFPQIIDSNSPDFWDKKFTDEPANLVFPVSDDRNSIVASLITPHSRVLNVGAGVGHLEHTIHKKVGKNIDWTGTDFTHKTLNDLKKKFSTYKFIQTGILPLPFSDNTFDVVCLLEVLEHIKPLETFAVLSELHRVTKPNGTILISVPVNEGLEEMAPNNPNSHVRVYSKRLLSFELQVSRFKIQKIIELTAFNSFYGVKKIINRILKLRQPNNLIFILKKK